MFTIPKLTVLVLFVVSRRRDEHKVGTLIVR